MTPGTSTAPGASGSPQATSTPRGSAGIAPSDAPSDAPSASPSDTTPPGGAAACTGSDNNRAFYLNFAHSTPWPVFCAVLPKGWYVDSGKSVLAGGGWLKISFKNGGSTRVALSEGSFCTDANGCVPSVANAGSAPFGTLSGLVYDLSGSGAPDWAIVVDGGQTPSWMLETQGLDQATTLAFAAALAQVGG